MIRTQIQLTEPQARQLKALAAEQGVSLAELIRRRLAECGSAVDPALRRARALSLAGRYNSRRKGVSAEHDRHLTEAFSQ